MKKSWIFPLMAYIDFNCTFLKSVYISSKIRQKVREAVTWDRLQLEIEWTSNQTCKLGRMVSFTHVHNHLCTYVHM